MFFTSTKASVNVFAISLFCVCSKLMCSSISSLSTMSKKMNAVKIGKGNSSFTCSRSGT